jgi:hypothetical protein
MTKSPEGYWISIDYTGYRGIIMSLFVARSYSRVDAAIFLAKLNAMVLS